jgi:putative addiction module component (TIGR02574 family)
VVKPAFDLSKLSVEEKLELIDDLWHSLREEDLPLSDELRAELDRRLDLLDRDGAVGRTWEEVRDDMTSRDR